MNTTFDGNKLCGGPTHITNLCRAALAPTSAGSEQSSNTRESGVEIAHIVYERTENSIETTDQHVVDTRTDPTIGGQRQTEVGNSPSPTADATKAHRRVGDEPLGQYRNNKPDDQPSAGLNVPSPARTVVAASVYYSSGKRG